MRTTPPTHYIIKTVQVFSSGSSPSRERQSYCHSASSLTIGLISAAPISLRPSFALVMIPGLRIAAGNPTLKDHQYHDDSNSSARFTSLPLLASTTAFWISCEPDGRQDHAMKRQLEVSNIQAAFWRHQRTDGRDHRCRLLHYSHRRLADSE